MAPVHRGEHRPPLPVATSSVTAAVGSTGTGPAAPGIDAAGRAGGSTESGSVHHGGQQRASPRQVSARTGAPRAVGAIERPAGARLGSFSEGRGVGAGGHDYLSSYLVTGVDPCGAWGRCW